MCQLFGESHYFGIWSASLERHAQEVDARQTCCSQILILYSIASKISMSHYRTCTLEKITSRSLPLLYFFENHPKDRFEAEKEICHHDPSANGCPWKRLLLHSPIHHCRGCESIGPDIFHGAPQGKARQIFSFRLYHNLPLFLIIFYMEIFFFFYESHQQTAFSYGGRCLEKNQKGED